MGGGGKGGGSTTIGYKYYLGMHIAICYGPVDAILRIEAGEKLVWEGSITGNSGLFINKPELFGGEKKEGGIQGFLDIEFGESDQGQNGYLVGQLGSDIPSFRGIMGLVLNKMYLTSITQYIKPWAVKVRRIPNKDWQSGYSNISGSANPIHIIREVLTNSTYGLGYPTTRIDNTSFSNAAQQLYNESFGLSLYLSGQTSIEDFVTTVLEHISGVMYADSITGNFKIKLIRDDYDEGSLVILDESNISELNSFERPQYAEMVNEIIVVYRPQGARKDESVTVHNLASIQAQKGVVSQTQQYPGIDTEAIASRVAQRDLRQYSTPIAQVRVTVNREGWQLEPGDVFKLSWDNHGIDNVIFRVTSINLGSLTSGQIIIDAVEDIFALPDASYIGEQPPLWQDPIGDPVPVIAQKMVFTPYWDLVMDFDLIKDSIEDTSTYIQMFAQKPNIATPAYLLESRSGTEANYTEEATGDYTPILTLNNSITYTDTNNIEVTLVGSLVSIEDTYAYIDDEVVFIENFDDEGYTLTIGRGCLDTVTANHSAGSRIWLAENFKVQGFREYVDGEEVRGIPRPRTGNGLLPVVQATDSIETAINRHFLPYPPGQFRINTQAYPIEITGQLDITWAHRDRLQQTAKPIISESANSIGPEAGTTYTLQLYDETDTLRRTETGLTGTSYSWTTEEADSLLTGRLNESVRVVLFSVRDGENSYQSHDFTVNRALPPYNTILPLVSGVAGVGETLSVTDGTWDYSPTSYTYQWLRDSVEIVGETNNTYLTVVGDSGTAISCRVTATNTTGSTDAISSNSINIP